MNKLKSKYFLIETTIFLVFNIFYFYYFTPPENIIFYDMDTRMMMDEIIQITQPSSFIDFVYDTLYGGRIIWGRFFHYFYAPILFLLKALLSNFLSIPQIIMLVNYNLLFFGLLIICKVSLKDKILRYSALSLLLTFEINSIHNLRTTSLEIFLYSILLLIIYKNYEGLKKKEVSIIGILLGILFAIKFTNIPYGFIFFAYLIYTGRKNYTIVYSASFVSGFLIAQPSILIPRVFKLFIDDIFHHLKYDEGVVTNFDWLSVIYNNYGKSLLILLVFSLIINKKLIAHNLIFLAFPFAALLQLISYLFSDGLIRPHYTKLPMIILLVYIFTIIDKLDKKIFFSVLFFTYVLIISYSNSINSFEFSISNNGNLSNVESQYSSSEQVKSMYKTLEYVKKVSEDKNISLIWWSVDDPGIIYPYSEFHWTSYENPEDYDFYIKEMFEEFEGFVTGSCSDYGGIAVHYSNSINKNLENKLFSKGYEFLKQFDLDSSNSDYNYRVYFRSQEGIPHDC